MLIEAGQFLAGLAALPAERYSHTPLIGRIWELRNKFTAYDATYIGLAEATNSVLYTGDEKLRRGHRARVILFTRIIFRISDVRNAVKQLSFEPPDSLQRAQPQAGQAKA